jgi:hypothetical protein
MRPEGSAGRPLRRSAATPALLEGHTHVLVVDQVPALQALKEGAAIQVVHANAPSADWIVCRGRVGEGVAPPRGSVSDGRQPTEREIQAAAVGGPAASQGGVWIRIASSGRSDEPGQRTVSLASLAWRALCLLADTPMLPGWDAGGRGHWAQLRRDPRPLPHRAGTHDPKPGAGASGARAVGGASPGDWIGPWEGGPRLPRFGRATT